MKSRTITRFVLWTLVAGLAATAPAAAFNPQPEPPGSMPLGIVETQIAQISVLHAPGSEVSGVEPSPFLVALGFYDGFGTLVASQELRVEARQAASIRLSGRDLGLRGNVRQTIYGVVECLGNGAQKVRCARSLNASMELFDEETGVTQVVVPLVAAIVPVLISG